MDLLYNLAAGLLIGIAFIHSFLGEKYILTRLFRKTTLPHLFGSDDFTKRTLRFAWHLTSIAWIGFAFILISLTELDSVMIARIIAVTFACHGILVLLMSKGKHLSWLVFFTVAMLAFINL